MAVKLIIHVRLPRCDNCMADLLKANQIVVCCEKVARWEPLYMLPRVPRLTTFSSLYIPHNETNVSSEAQSTLHGPYNQSIWVFHPGHKSLDQNKKYMHCMDSQYQYQLTSTLLHYNCK